MTAHRTNMLRLLAPLLLLTALLQTSCTKLQFISGSFNQQQLADTLRWPRTTATGYKPSPAALAILDSVKPFQATVFFSSWCHDSKREVPRFNALLNYMPAKDVQYVALDTSRTQPPGVWADNKLRSTPTFVFYRDGKELGRIIERPEGTLEDHIARIVR